MMVLCLDFGNSQLKYACFENEQLLESGSIEDVNSIYLSPICLKYKVDSIILSSVIDVPIDFIHHLKAIAPFHLLSKGSISHVNYQEYDLSGLGVDRMAIAEGAHNIYPSSNHLSICLGTCITYNWVEHGYFKGGAISPGLMLRTKSMHDYTAHLPLISPQIDFPMLGQTTSSNLIAGTMYGILFEIKGYVTELRKRDPEIKILLCGGDAPYFIPSLENHNIHFEKELIWNGLVALAKLNLGL